MQTARRPRFRSVVRDALRLRCPNKIFPECASCGLSFFREQGYYIGGMMITYGLTLAVVIPVFLVSLVLPDLRIVSENARFALWVLFAVPLSFLLMPCAYSLWLHLDFWLEPWKPPQRS